MHESEKCKWSCSVVFDSLQLHGLQPTRLLRPWDFPGKSTGVGCHCLLHLLAYITPNPLYQPFSLPCNHPPWFFLTADYFACCIHRTSYKWNHSFSMKACFHSISCFVNTSKIMSFQTHISPGTLSYQNHGYKAFFSSKWNTAGPWRWRWASLQVTSNYHKLP